MARNFDFDVFKETKHYYPQPKPLTDNERRDNLMESIKAFERRIDAAESSACKMRLMQELEIRKENLEKLLMKAP